MEILSGLILTSYREDKPQKGHLPMNMKRAAILSWAGKLGICAETNRPGDGTRVYNFFMPGERPHTVGEQLCRCLGAREAELYLRGYSHGERYA